MAGTFRLTCNTATWHLRSGTLRRQISLCVVEVCVRSAAAVIRMCHRSTRPRLSAHRDLRPTPPRRDNPRRPVQCTGRRSRWRFGFSYSNRRRRWAAHAYPDDDDAAQKTLDLQYFIFRGDTTGHLILDALTRAASRGVAIRLLVDDGDTVDGDEQVLALRTLAGVEVRVFNPFPLPRTQPHSSGCGIRGQCQAT